MRSRGFESPLRHIVSYRRILSRGGASIMKKGNVAVLLSGRGSNFAAIVRASRRPGANFSVRLAISDRGDAAGLKKAARLGIPARHVDPCNFPGKAADE